jgi:uncharacterized protein (DUF2141 family)
MPLSIHIRSACLALAFPAVATAGQDLRVVVTGIESTQGEITCLLYAGGEGFPNDAERAERSATYPSQSPLLTCTFDDVEPGRYAVAAVHDENGNGELDTNFRGFYKEPWGVSNNVRPASRAPRFLESSFYVTPEQPAMIEIALQR